MRSLKLMLIIIGLASPVMGANAGQMACAAVLSSGEVPKYSRESPQKNILVISDPMPAMDRAHSRWVFEAALEKIMALEDMKGLGLFVKDPIRCEFAEGELSQEQLQSWRDGVDDDAFYSKGRINIKLDRTFNLTELLPAKQAEWALGDYWMMCETHVRQDWIYSQAIALDFSRPEASQLYYAANSRNDSSFRNSFLGKAIEALNPTLAARGVRLIDPRVTFDGERQGDGTDLMNFYKCKVYGFQPPNGLPPGHRGRAYSGNYITGVPLPSNADAKPVSTARAASQANAAKKSGIVLASPRPTPAELEAQDRVAEIEKEKKRLGAHREAEIRRMVELREAAEKARPAPKCKAKQITLGSNSTHGTSLLHPGWNTRREALAQAMKTADLSSRCRGMTGNATFGTVKEDCVQDKFGKWECSIQAVCATAQQICAGEQ